MPWILLLVGACLAGYWLHRWSKHADRIEDDAAYLYEGQRAAGYGTKFLNILRGRGND